MKTYTVYFEAFGRKMRTDVIASNESNAKLAVIDKIKFFKCEAKDGESASEFMKNEWDEIMKIVNR